MRGRTAPLQRELYKNIISPTKTTLLLLHGEKLDLYLIRRMVRAAGVNHNNLYWYKKGMDVGEESEYWKKVVKFRCH